MRASAEVPEEHLLESKVTQGQPDQEQIFFFFFFKFTKPPQAT